MIAAVANNTPAKPDLKPCVVYFTSRVRLSVRVLTYCGQTRDASEGVLQLPEEVPVCVECQRAIEAHSYPKITW